MGFATARVRSPNSNSSRIWDWEDPSMRWMVWARAGTLALPHHQLGTLLNDAAVAPWTKA